MTLRDVLKNFDNKNFKVIEYRAIVPAGNSNEEILVGMAAYKNKMLQSLDGDSYHLSDEIVRYELYQDDWLVVWEK